MTGKRKNPSPELLAGEEVGTCFDLVWEILVRLPLISILRFKVVSKLWLKVISDPRFAYHHIRLNPNKSPSGLFFYDSPNNGSPSIRSVSLADSNNIQNGSIPSLEYLDPVYKVVQSCNGLLLYRTASISRWNPVKFFILNPTTRNSKELPQPENSGTRSCITSCTLAYNPCLSLYYKVVYVSCLNKWRSSCQIHVYSSKDSSWRIFSHILQPKWPANLECGTYWNGAVYWVTSKGESIWFDLISGSLKYNYMPRSLGASYRYLGQSHDRLHFVKLCGPSAKRFYLQERFRNGWITKYSVNVHQLVVSFFPEIANTFCDGNVFAFSLLSVVGATELDTELVLRIPGKVIAYNYWKKTVKELLDVPGELAKSSCVSGYHFIATLAPV